MISSIRINNFDPSEDEVENSWPKNKYELKHADENVQLMRNRVQLLRKQLLKQKKSMQRHKSLTDQTVQQKIELNKISSIKHRDYNAIGEQISSLRARNHSYRETHKNQMNNILKALYMVKMDDAQQIKNASMQNRKSLERVNENYYQEQKQKKKQIMEESERAKQKYLQYWKEKINGVYNQGQRKLKENGVVAQERRRQLQQLQMEEMNLLEEINQTRTKDVQAKKEYVAALSLKNREVSEAINGKEQSQSLVFSKPQKSREERILSRSESIQEPNGRFFTKSPIVSFMSSSNVQVPRANVDQKKLHIILKELRRQPEALQQMQNY